MKFSIKSGNPSKQRTACLVLGVHPKCGLSASAKVVDRASGGYLSKILRDGDMEGKPGQTVMLYNVPGTVCKRILLVGCGPEKEFTMATARKVVTNAVAVLNRSGATEAISSLSEIKSIDGSSYIMLRDTVIAATNGAYRFDRCKSEAKAPKKPLQKLALLLSDRRQLKLAKRAVAHGQAIANGTSMAKDLGNLPGNICTPTYLANEAKKLGRKSKNLQVKVLTEKQMEKLGMGALLSVSKGSRQPAKLIVMEYRGGKASSKPVVLVGKGLTFDAGGISIKPSNAMDEMKYDMCGGASVLGTMAACVEMNLPINLVGIIPTSENLPDGAANKPGDIVTSMSGQTIEVFNTDAEGRLILCDALTYAERYKPAVVVDIATLTGACVVALGHHASGLLGNNDKLIAELQTAGEQSGDRVWQLPLWDEYQKQIDSPFADIANIGTPGGGAGTVTAACFLSRFTKKFNWAHLDIAGSAWNSGKAKGATGRPVPLLTQFLLKRCGRSG
jgi:leucyl aminopeptidase